MCINKKKELDDLKQNAKETKQKILYETSEFFILLKILRNSVQVKCGGGFFFSLAGYVKIKTCLIVSQFAKTAKYCSLLAQDEAPKDCMM